MVDEKLSYFLVCYENFQRAPLPLLFTERTSQHAEKLNFPKEAALVGRALWCKAHVPRFILKMEMYLLFNCSTL